MALYRSLNDRMNICDVLIMISLVSGDEIQKHACLEEALALARERGDAITMAGALDNLGNLALFRGDFSLARARFEDSLEIQLPLGAPGYIGTLQLLSKLGMYEGKLAEARTYWNEMNTMSKQYGLAMGLPYLWALSNVGYIDLREGNLVPAREMFSLSIQQFQEANNLIGIVYAVEGVASLLVNQGQIERAARLFAWADARREEIGDRRPFIEQASVDKDLAVIRATLTEAEFANFSAEGSTMTTEQAIALALEEM